MQDYCCACLQLCDAELERQLGKTYGIQVGCLDVTDKDTVSVLIKAAADRDIKIDVSAMMLETRTP